MGNEDIKKVIVDELKAAGVEVAEEAAIGAAKAMFKVIPKILLSTENKFDDLLIPVFGIIEPKVLELLDKIDGQVG